ncbi:Serine/threonine-protein kinase SCH9 [Lasiodiplodia hormozganensis]|uniref:non-specific serine/threonine protein kinase n=2 Tax=Lasiodiplodia TaxID=66739 RepID=A0A5N5DFF5_9PEZI|nr:C2 calcium-dependent membrane targeting protein [Lasiodiplodia theobromae]KAB2576583.1 Serine/threonine-protein kinase SCH9 [Lasiodiplodia theobromae]KAF4546628.1 C2 calcium-dependent membrane targeting protein [Lasiodiplodia theobromae]KAK0663542.1 Serine/threonine-protein kinase SCH9 [Lasiodiplodia hormozganensis]
MATHDQAPSAATDLLRQAMMQRVGDDDHDHIGSNSSTPPGIETPRPDPTDKRQPGILSYFGQVRSSLPSIPSVFRPRTSLSGPSASAQPSEPQEPSDSPDAQRDEGAERGRAPEPTVGAGALPTAPSSPSKQSGGEHSSPPLLPHERLSAPQGDASFSYPTPPASSASSLHRVSKGENSTSTSGPSSPSSAEDKNDGSCASTPRRQTLAMSDPVSSVTTTTAVPAAHFSTPSSTAPSNPPTTLSHSDVANPSACPAESSPNEEGKTLTENVARAQNTPPQTPRTQSQEGKVTSNPSQSARSSGSTGGSNSGVIAPKGKLSVSITEGRGLRPSVDPYVVCQFQWAEDISDGPKKGEEPPRGAMAMMRTDSDSGRAMAIPMRSRQSSNHGWNPQESRDRNEISDPKWDHNAVFDVVGDHAEIDVSVYDKSNNEAFLGHVRFCPNLVEYEKPLDAWFHLEPREGEQDFVTGEIHLRVNFQKVEKKHYGPEDFQILKLIGKGTFGQVFQVRKKDTGRIYAMKVLSKKVIVQKKEVAHTLGERNILVRTAMADSPFIVGLKFSFQTPTDLYLVTDYMSGGELFWHLQKEGRFNEARAKFYIAELILALQHLHEHDIVYRDLKPENILLDANGHIALCDFGLSKANLTENDTTNTFCGTTEYLAPEVLLDEHGYTKMVDFWSLGVLVFEMCCGWSPFYAEDTQQMYKNIAFGKVRFPRDALSTEGRNFVKGLLNRNPKHRLGANRDAEELKAHPFFADIDWEALSKKNLVPPFKPKLKSELDTSNFDPEFTNALNQATSLNARAAALAAGMNPASTPLSPTMQANFKGFTFVDDNHIDEHFGGREFEMEDERLQDPEWDKVESPTRTERMSGVLPSNDHDENIFNNHNGAGFEV